VSWRPLTDGNAGTLQVSMSEQQIRAALDRHWAASDASDFEREHDIYLEDAVLEYPQSGERIRGRHNIKIPARFSRAKSASRCDESLAVVIFGSRVHLSYDGKPSYT